MNIKMKEALMTKVIGQFNSDLKVGKRISLNSLKTLNPLLKTEYTKFILKDIDKNKIHYQKLTNEV